MANGVWLKGNGIRKEGKASTAIRPGHLIMWDGNGVDTTLGVRTCNKNPATPGLTPTRKAFALENDLIGRGVPVTPSDTSNDYAINDVVQYLVPDHGAEIQAWLRTGENVAIGDPLVSDGTGALRKGVTSMGNDDEEIVAYSMQALNNVTGFDARLKIEVA